MWSWSKEVSGHKRPSQSYSQRGDRMGSWLLSQPRRVPEASEFRVSRKDGLLGSLWTECRRGSTCAHRRDLAGGLRSFTRGVQMTEVIWKGRRRRSLNRALKDEKAFNSPERRRAGWCGESPRAGHRLCGAWPGEQGRPRVWGEGAPGQRAAGRGPRRDKGSPEASVSAHCPLVVSFSRAASQRAAPLFSRCSPCIGLPEILGSPGRQATCAADRHARTVYRSQENRRSNCSTAARWLQTLAGLAACSEPQFPPVLKGDKELWGDWLCSCMSNTRCW